jgi:hypothetical protein
MFRALTSRLRHVISGRLARTRPIQRPRPACDLILERLEDRLVLDSYLWAPLPGGQAIAANKIPGDAVLGLTGNVGLWEDWHNWKDQTPGRGNSMTYPGDNAPGKTVPDTADIVGPSCYLTSDVTISGLSMMAAKGDHLLIGPGHILTIKKGTFTLSNGSIDLLEDQTAAHKGSSLLLESVSDAEWTGGQIRAYPNNPVARYAMRAKAKCSMAM